GKPVESFGDNGIVNLSKGLVWEVNPKHYTNTSPTVVYKDLVIVGNGVADRCVYKKDPPGDVRAFHARTGKLVWTFHTIPQRGEYGSDTWGGANAFTGHTNVRAPMSLDETLGLLYLPVSTPGNDFYGGRLPGRICSRTRSCAWMPLQAHASGTFNSSITGCGIMMCRRRPDWSRYIATTGRSM